MTKAVLQGAHVSDDVFGGAQVEFDCLTPWVRPPPVRYWDTNSPIPRIRIGDIEIAHVTLASGQIVLHAGGSGTMAEQRIIWEQQTIIDLKFEGKSILEIIDTWVRPIQDLLIFILGRPVRLTAFRLRNNDQSSGEEWITVHFEVVQPEVVAPVDSSALVRRSAPTLFSFNESPLSFDDLVTHWFSLYNNIRRAVKLLNAPHYVEFMFNEQRYSSIFMSAEALFKPLGIDGREMSPTEHTARVDAIVAAAQAAQLDDEHIRWAARVLQSRNDKPLQQKIKELTESTGDVGAAIMAACPDFSAKATSARTPVSHGGTTDDLSATERYRLGDVLRWVVRARILISLGVNQETAGSIVSNKAAFRYAVACIRSADR
jgi:hypothetical protein